MTKLSHASEADLGRLATMLDADPSLAGRLSRSPNPLGALKAVKGTDAGELSLKLFSDRARRLGANARVTEAVKRSGLPWEKLDGLSDDDLGKLSKADTDLAKAREGHRPGTADMAKLEKVEKSLEGVSSVDGGARDALRAEIAHGHGLSGLPFMRDPAGAMRAKFAGKIPDTAMDQLAGLHPDALRGLETLTDDDIHDFVRLLTSRGAAGAKDVEDILRSYMYKAQKASRKSGEALAPPAKVTSRLEESMNVLDEVRARGYPYGFASKADYETFMRGVEDGLKRRGIDGTPKVQGSAMHSRTPGDIDMEIVVTEAEFERLGKKFVDSATSKHWLTTSPAISPRRRYPRSNSTPITNPRLPPRSSLHVEGRGPGDAHRRGLQL